jgi:DHA3 family tetracycline resistance protein-like MFS transporter
MAKMIMHNPRGSYIILESLRAAALGTILPVFALYYRHFEISLLQIAVLAAVFEATILLFEVPSGIWADRFSRRSAIIVSEVFLTIGGVIFVGWPGLWFFIIGEIMQGIGEACGSGSLEAWVVDELQIGDQRAACESLFASALRWKTIAMLGGAFLAGFWGAASLRWAWLPFVILHAGGACLSLSIRETRFPGGEVASAQSQTCRIISSGIDRLKHSLVLQILVGFGLICAFAEEGIDEFWQVHLDETLHVPVVWFGLVVAVPGILIFLLAPRMIGFLSRRLPPALAIMVFQILLAGGVFGFAVLGPLPAVFSLGAVFMLVELKRPLVSAWANRQLAGEHRAGVLSFLNMLASAGEVAASLVFGLLAGLLGLSIVFILAGGVSLVAILILFRGHRRTVINPENRSGEEGS